MFGLCQRLITPASLKEWLAEVARIEYEHRVSSRFLPWGNLVREAELQPMDSTTVAIIDELGCIFWDPKTLITTLVFNLLTEGEARTVIPYQRVRQLHRLVTEIKTFVAKAKKKFAEYLGRLTPTPNQRETHCLWQMFDLAMATLQKEIAEQGSLDDRLCRWFYLVHVESTHKIFFDSFAESDLINQEETSPAEELLELIEAKSPSKEIIKRLKKLNWPKIIDGAYADTLIQYLDADLVLGFVPLTPEMVSRICDFWKSRLGQMAWPPPKRLKLAQKLLPRPFKTFWKHLPP